MKFGKKEVKIIFALLIGAFAFYWGIGDNYIEEGGKAFDVCGTPTFKTAIFACITFFLMYARKIIVIDGHNSAVNLMIFIVDILLLSQLFVLFDIGSEERFKLFAVFKFFSAEVFKAALITAAIMLLLLGAKGIATVGLLIIGCICTINSINIISAATQTAGVIYIILVVSSIYLQNIFRVDNIKQEFNFLYGKTNVLLEDSQKEGRMLINAATKLRNPDVIIHPNENYKIDEK